MMQSIAEHSTDPRSRHRDAPGNRRAALLDAALHLIGAGGMRAATHRAVERQAGLPHGSTTYYFHTRDQLVEAAVGRLVELDARRADALAHAISMALARRSTTGGELDVGTIAPALAAWVEHDRSLHLARTELFLEAARRPNVRELMVAAGERFVRLAEPIALSAGSDDPQHDARIGVAMLHGIILDQLWRPAPDFAAEIAPRALRKLLAALGAP